MVQINNRINANPNLNSTRKTDSTPQEGSTNKQTNRYQVNFESQGGIVDKGSKIFEAHYKSYADLELAFKNGNLKAGDTWDKFGPNGDKIGTGTVSYVDPDGRYWW